MAYLLMTVASLLVHDGAAWRVYRLQAAMQLIERAAVCVLLAIIPTPDYESHRWLYITVAVGRMGGALGNGWLAVMLLRTVKRPPWSRTRATD